MRTTPDALMLFTAGLGTRMGALTADRPKPLIEVAGRALVDHAFDQVDEMRISTVVANLHYRPDQITAHLSGRRNIRFSAETETILETGGGLRQALPLLGDGPVYTLNTDAVWTGANPLAELRDAWDPARMDALMLLVPTERATGHAGPGDFDRDADGRLHRGTAFVYTGAQIVATGGLAAIPDKVFSLNLLWDRMLMEGQLFGLVHDGGWCDVGRPEAIPLAEALLREAKGV